MDNIKIEISQKELNETFNIVLNQKIKDIMALHMDNIETSIKQYFQKSFLNNKETVFENAIDWSIEHVFRQGIDQAMQELDFKEMISEKAKELLSSEDWIKTLAGEKVRSSLGLPKK